MDRTKNPLELDEKDKEVLRKLDDLSEKDLLDLLRDLRAERALEYQIYATREQWLWVPWTACLTATIIALNSSLVVIRIGVALITAAFAYWIANRRRTGLLSSYDALNMRHKWVVAITQSGKDFPRLKTLGFDDRLLKQKDGVPLDLTHALGFRYPLDARWWTLCFWLPLILIAVLSAFVNWHQ